MAYCENCGAKIPDDSKFCEFCGAKVEALPERPVQGERKTGTSQKNGGKIKAVITAVILLAAVGIAALFFAGKGKGGGEDEVKKESRTETVRAASETKPAETPAAIAETVPEKETEPEVWTTPVIEEDTAGQGMREIGTVTGGTWKKTDSGIWYYELDGRTVRDSWVTDDGSYYYVDGDGYLLTDGITPDGYYVDEYGVYVPNAQTGSGTADAGNTSSGSGIADIAMRLSTEEIAYATEFEWFLDLLGGGTNGAALLITDPERASVFTDPAGMNGGWKAFSKGAETERYFNASVSTDGDMFNVTMNWKYLWISSVGQSVDESASDLFKGTFDKNTGTAAAQSDYGRVVLEKFYVSADGSAQYATGKFFWISGEVDDIALMRVKE